MKNHSKTIAALSQPQREMIEQGMNVVVGLDLGDRHSHLCLLDLEGNIVEREEVHRIRTSVAAFKKFFDEWAPMRVVFEAGTHSLWVWRKRLGHQPLMADTHHLALTITQSLSKSDPHSRRACWASWGCVCPRCCTPSVFAGDASGSQRAAGARRRRAGTHQVINMVRGTVKSFGEQCTTEAFAKKASCGHALVAARHAGTAAAGDPTPSATRSAATTKRSRSWAQRNIRRRYGCARSPGWGRSRRWRSC